MTDSYLLYAPLILLVVVALFRFVGCLSMPPPPPADRPTFDPPQGGYLGPQMVTIISELADIFYTTDGSEPTVNSTKYSGSVLISSQTTLNAIGSFMGSLGPIGTATYYIGPITHVQSAETAGSAGTTNPFPNPIGQGNLIVVWTFYQSDTAEVAQITDSVGNHYIQAIGPTATPDTPTFRQELWYAFNINPGSGVQVTVSFQGGTIGESDISAHEYTNAYQLSDGPLADTPSPGTTGTGAAVSTTPVITNGRLLFAAATFRSSGAPGGGFNPVSSLQMNVAEDQSIPAPGTSVQALFTNNSAGTGWVAQMITLK